MSSDLQDQEWKVDCSDDENYGLVYSELCQEWVPDPISVAQLYQSYSSKESGITELDWICPGRKDPHASDAEGEVESEEPKIEKKKSDFDFLDEPNSMKLGPRRVPGNIKQPRGSAKKKTTSLDGILSSMRRHRKMDQIGKPLQTKPK